MRLRAIAGLLALGCGALSVWVTSAAAPPPEPATASELRLLWGRGTENSDPALLYYRERWFCALRERGSGQEEGGAVRVVSSPDARIWQSHALLRLPEEDLRHPSLSAAPDGRLLVAAEAHSKRLAGPPPRTFLWTSADGRDWEGPVQPLEAGIVLPALRWRLNRAYAFGLDAWDKEPVRLYSSADGLKYSLHAAAVADSPAASPWCLLFARDGRALATSSGPKPRLGESRPPYRAWSWRELGAPGAIVAMEEMPDGRIAAAVVRQDSGARLILGWLDPEAATWSPALPLPAKGFTGSAGIYAQGNSLLVAFSSEHEGRRMVYVAEVNAGRR